MDELGVYSIDDKSITFTDSVMALALVTDLAREMEGVRAPVVGGMYWSAEDEKSSLARAKYAAIENIRIPYGMRGEILGGNNG
jgi:hypothetical protein